MDKTLFGAEDFASPQTPRRGGSSSSIIFKDYASFVAKFTDKPKTTDDCYTPAAVYDAVLEYVRAEANIGDRPILRPFYPGGDYTRLEDYPPDGVVIDNPPFSILSQIVRFYTREQIPFFLFANGMTVFSLTDYACAVVVNQQVTFANGAAVRVNFLTNLFPERARTAPELNEALRRCAPPRAKYSRYADPNCVLAVSDMQLLADSRIDFRVPREESLTTQTLGEVKTFGSRILMSASLTRLAEEAKAKAEKVRAEMAPPPIVRHLSPAQERAVAALGLAKTDLGGKD